MSLPKHVSIIMDGNGRWAKARGKERLFGHQAGTESVRQAVETAAELGIAYLSLFAFSSENWGRPKVEVDGLMELLVRAVHAETPSLIENNVKLLAIGEISHLPVQVRECFGQSVRDTACCTGLQLILALSYSGTWDILQAANRYAADLRSGKVEANGLDAALFESYLSTSGIPHPDLLIRTSGEQRISNFMLWQLAYTEFYFSQKLWPDFRREDFLEALEEYAGRERRFGKTENKQ
ncbi:MAG: polyprenyl diphosphate synthase [Bacteroidales bacterium]|nr:polyprenyl diphosphate synthase [Bacteroidales bacterium]MCL2737994.1 polyprenyl diphosphate synthase [Bacteroidales bacterium]